MHCFVQVVSSVNFSFLHCGVCMPRCKTKNLCECPVMTLTNSLPKYFWLHMTCEFTEIPLFCALLKSCLENRTQLPGKSRDRWVDSKIFVFMCKLVKNWASWWQSQNFVSPSLKRTPIFQWSWDAYRSEDKSPVIRCQKKSNPIFCRETTVKIIALVANAKFLNGSILKLR